MESALTPREIQARIRGGESLTRVAELAGVPVEQIDVYAGPVLAEREHAALLARESQVRRRGESSSQRLLGEVVADNLEAKGVSPDDIRWDAWRDEDRRWTVQASWILDGTERQAHFNFDLRGRVSAAADEQARALINEAPRATGPGGDPDSEPTIDLNDELALVRAVQADTEPPAVVPDQPSARIIKLPGELTRDEEPNDYAPAELEQVDGVYDIIPNPRNDMDVLYDMLAGFNEDSVRIYAGLTQPVSPQPEQRPEPEQVPQAQPPREPEPQAAQTPASMPQSTTPQATMTSRPAASTHPRPKPGPRTKPGPAPRPAPASQPKSDTSASRTGADVPACDATCTSTSSRARGTRDQHARGQPTRGPARDRTDFVGRRVRAGRLGGPASSQTRSPAEQTAQARLGAHLGRDHVRRSAATDAAVAREEVKPDPGLGSYPGQGSRPAAGRTSLRQ